jgi:hypothetical protein
MKTDDQKQPKMLSWWKVALLYIGLILFVTTVISLVNNDKMYYNLAAGIIISWIIALVLYYFWAIYFYNVNMGWEQKDWDDLEKKKGGQPGLLDDEPVVNPNAQETLGLPPGTVRATIALTLLVGALALMLASLELPHKLEQNNFFIDNFEFIKTAFLMMVAFYFGNKSLDFLKSRSPVYGAKNATQTGDDNQVETLTSPVLGSEAKQIIKTNQHPETQDDNKTSAFDDKEAQG